MVFLSFMVTALSVILNHFVWTKWEGRGGASRGPWNVKRKAVPTRVNLTWSGA